jgi:hypothetical protein
MHIFHARVSKSSLVYHNKKVLDDFFAVNDEKEVWVRIERVTGKRSMSQNNFYWFYLSLIANETGHTEDELHSLFKRIFLPPRYKTILGREMKLPASTTELSKPEFGEYLDRICAETNVPIPVV